MIEVFVNQAAHLVALIAELVAIFVIFSGIFKLVIIYIKNMFYFQFDVKEFVSIRSKLGSALSLSLELLIGADILKTAIAPTWNEIGMLASVVVIRTVLNYFLNQEIRSVI